MSEVKKNLICVYGSLRKGCGNHGYYLSNADFLGEFKTPPTYSLYTLGGFPGLKEGGKTAVTMEVYAVTANEEKAVDSLEGYNASRKPSFYDKVPIETPYGPAHVYTYVSPIPENQLVPSGDWKEFREKKYVTED